MWPVWVRGQEWQIYMYGKYKIRLKEGMCQKIFVGISMKIREYGAPVYCEFLGETDSDDGRMTI